MCICIYMCPGICIYIYVYVPSAVVEGVWVFSGLKASRCQASARGLVNSSTLHVSQRVQVLN